MRIMRKDIENKVARLAIILPKKEGYDLALSVVDFGDGNRYQLNWKSRETGEEFHIGYNSHVKGPRIYALMEGIEEGLYQLERKLP